MAMRAGMFSYLIVIILGIVVGSNFAQGQQPPVSEMIKTHDRNANGMLEFAEVARSRYERQFPRWDANEDRQVTAKEIIDFRKRFGIAEDGTSIKTSAKTNQHTQWVVPNLSELKRIGKNQTLTREDARNSSFVIATEPHESQGEGYLIITDHFEDEFLQSLRVLAEFYDGNLLTVKDLATLHQEPGVSDELRSQLMMLNPMFVAIAPRLESFRENMLMNMWEILSNMDDDPQLDVYPGILVASTAESLSQLIEQSIDHKSVKFEQLRPLAISQVSKESETRSLQKAAMLRNHFLEHDIETPIVAIYGEKATSAPRLGGKQVWNLQAPRDGTFVKSFASDLSKQIDESNLIIMHGHGVPGMSCSVDLEGLPDDLQGKVLMTGSCFSASPKISDLPKMRDAPGGYTVEEREAFILRAIDQGALVAFGHQRLSSGFPHLYPVLESWLAGSSVGEGYQRLINALIEQKSFQRGQFVIQEKTKKPSQNSLLYVVIGDPALQPFQR
jgi:hypothetical protein